MVPIELLPEGEKWCVAGGYAACPALANDQDIWVMVNDEDSVTDARERLLDHLRTFFGEDFDDRVEVQTEVRTGQTGDDSAPDGGAIPILRVAKFFYHGIERHLLVAHVGCVTTLLRTFDISTHQVGIDSDGMVFKGPDYTPPHVPPVKLKETPTTDARMVKIAQRFGHPVEAILG